MIIHNCPNALCRTPLDTGKCRKECIKRYEKEMGIKTTYAEIEKKTLEQIYEDIKRFKNLVEVVRCKDCKRWKYDAKKMAGLCKRHINYTAEWDFCSYGERKDNEGRDH